MNEIIEEKPILRDGKIIGFKQYTKSKYCFGLSFCGYRWL